MKRIGNLYPFICDLKRIELADTNARRGKNNIGIIKHDRHKEENYLKLQKSLINGTYKTSKYDVYKIYEPKEREIYRLPYYPDRILHWDIVLTLEHIWNKIFIKNTYSCIKGRGIHKCVQDVKKALEDKIGTTYCLKLDIRKFYPSINHDILKQIIRKKIKDKQLLNLLDEIIDSTDGIPIGNYLSQFFANLYLSYFDHWLKEEVKIRYYFRYADDIIILSDNKEELRKYLILIKIYLKYILNLEVKGNYQIFPVESRGIDFVGYVFYHNYTKIRKSIKQKIFKIINKYKQHKLSFDDLSSKLSSYFGWLKYCDSKNLLFKIEKLTGLHFSNWNGGTAYFKKGNIRIIEVVPRTKYYEVHYIYKKNSYTIKSRNVQNFNKLLICKYPLNCIIYGRKS